MNLIALLLLALFAHGVPLQNMKMEVGMKIETALVKKQLIEPFGHASAQDLSVVPLEMEFIDMKPQQFELEKRLVRQINGSSIINSGISGASKLTGLSRNAIIAIALGTFALSILILCLCCCCCCC